MIIKTNPKAVFKEICVWESISSESKTQSLNPEEPVRATQTVITLFECAVPHCNTTEDPLNSWLPTSARLLEPQSFIRETSLHPHTNKQKPNDSLRYKWQRPMRSSSAWGRERERWRQRDQREAAGGGKGDDLKVDEESSWNCRWCWMYQVSTTDSPPPRFFFLFLYQSFIVATWYGLSAVNLVERRGFKQEKLNKVWVEGVKNRSNNGNICKIINLDQIGDSEERFSRSSLSYIHKIQQMQDATWMRDRFNESCHEVCNRLDCLPDGIQVKTI